MSTSADDRTAAAARLVEQVVTLTRLVHAVKAAESRRSAHALLFPLSALGPVRLTALADAVRADASTASRQVSDLVDEGLVRRERDPDDGRAQLLAVTAQGAALVERMRLERARATAAALSSWSTDELEAFATGFTRFTADLAASLPGPQAARTPFHATSPEDR